MGLCTPVSLGSMLGQPMGAKRETKLTAAALSGRGLHELAGLVRNTAGALAAEGSLPGVLAVLIISRDVLLVGGAVMHRARSLNWQQKDWTEFVRLSKAPNAIPDVESGRRSDQRRVEPGTAALENQSAPATLVQPLYISKVNTCVQLSLIGACITSSWYAWPGDDGILLLAGTAGVTTIASGLAYLRQFLSNKA
ncbi:hypothetical protein WJX73_007657 [Symbiochloris irregularis]|uniref:Transmembrane protein n=1 Tax=Symbiochloris irregularis TaxID=706552 RepID=A0AAW1NH27_9CHLO